MDRYKREEETKRNLGWNAERITRVKGDVEDVGVRKATRMDVADGA